MANIIKVRCNGPGKHVNEVDIDKVLDATVVLRGGAVKKGRTIPKRLVLACQVCSEGKVIVTHDMLEGTL